MREVIITNVDKSDGSLECAEGNKLGQGNDFASTNQPGMGMADERLYNEIADTVAKVCVFAGAATEQR